MVFVLNFKVKLKHHHKYKLTKIKISYKQLDSDLTCCI